MHGQSVLEQLRFRHHPVKHRTQICNRLQALAHAAGLPKKGIQTKRARIALMAANFTATQSFERDHLFELLDDLTERIKAVEQWLEGKAEGDAQVQLLLTHKGIGLLSALAVVHTLGDINRFASSKEAVAYTGLDPLEKSSAGKIRFSSISKAGSAVLRHLLGQAMHVAGRYDGELRSFYKRLASRRTKSIAKVATTRKLLVRLFIMLRDGIDYAEFKRRGSTVGMPVLFHGLKQPLFDWATNLLCNKSGNETNIMGLRLIKKIGLHARIDE
jgi:transposase